MSGNDILNPIPNGLFPLPGLALFSFPSYSHWLFLFPHSYSRTSTTTANTNKYVPTKRRNNMVIIKNNIKLLTFKFGVGNRSIIIII